MSKYIDVNGNADDLRELAVLLDQQGVENHLGTAQRFSAATPDIISLLINTVPYASIAGVLIAWIRMKQNRKVHIQYMDNTSITLEGHFRKEEVEYYFNQKERAQIVVESDRLVMKKSKL